MTYKVTGVTRNNAGVVLGSCECFLFKYNSGTGIFTQVGTSVTSHATTGAFAFTGLADNASAYQVVFYKNGSPNVFDVTDRNLTPVVEPTGGAEVLHLDASNAASITVVSGLVSQMNDLSSSGYVFTQSTAAERPVFDTVHLQNGLTILACPTGATDPGLSLLCPALNIAQPFTVFCVYQCSAGGPYEFLFDSVTGNNRVSLLNRTASAGALSIAAPSNLVSSSNREDMWTVGTGIYNGASSQIFINGISEGTGSVGSNSFVAGDGMKLFQYVTPGGNGYRGNFGELLIYPGAVAGGTITTTVNALKSKWGITS